MKSPLDKIDYVSLMNLGSRRKKGPNPKYATFNRRMMAATIDSLIGMILLAPPVDLLFNRLYPAPDIDIVALQEKVQMGREDPQAVREFWETLYTSGYITRWINDCLAQMGVLVLASAICWHFWAATPGKMIMRLRIADAKTEKPISDMQIILRSLGYFVSGLSFFMGFFWIGLDKRKQGWHDKLADTVVLVIPWRKKAKSTSEAVAPSDSPEPSGSV